MSDKRIEFTRRRVLGGIVTVGAASAAVGAGTFALFSDEGSSTGNTIQAGTIDLESTSSAVINATNIVPTWGPEAYDIETTYDSASSVDPVNLTVDISLSQNDASNNPTPDLTATQFGQKIQVNTAELTSTGTGTNDLTSGLSARTTGHPGSQSYIDLDQVAGSYTDALTTVSPGDTVTLNLDLEMPGAVGNDAQGDGVDIAVTFTAEQPSS